MNKLVDIIEKKPIVGWLLFGGTLAGVFGLGLIGSSIVERRQESYVANSVTPLPEWESNNDAWAQAYPRQYESYIRTADMDFRSKYAGSVPVDNLAAHPHTVVLWAGYPFSHDYNQGRGHAYAVTDIRNTLRTTTETGPAPLPGTCWTCKSPDVPRLMHQYSEAAIKSGGTRRDGIALFYKGGQKQDGSWATLGSGIHEFIGCLDCHDPKTMRLRISRPALVEAWQRQGKDITKATHQEMRSLVCAQCHVEYYFDKEKYLFFPWDGGRDASGKPSGFATIEEMEAYYDGIGFYDWIHPLSKTPMLKAQHPDYEMFRSGIHGQRGLSCADCHMPFKSEGGVKHSDHQMRSPLANISQSCGVCHRESEAALRKNVEDRQDAVNQMLHLAEESLSAAHIEACEAWKSGATDEEMKPVQTLIRHAQWRWDFVAASNGVGFHAPVESLRILGTSIDKAGQARTALRGIRATHGITTPISRPDLSTKEKAQDWLNQQKSLVDYGALKVGERIPIDRTRLRETKDKFLRETVPTWDRK